MEMPPEEVDDIRRADRIPASLDQGVGESGETSLGELIPLDGPTPDEEVAEDLRDAAIRQAVQELPDPERDVLTLRFGLGQPAPVAITETGRKLGLKVREVREIEDRALKRLAKDGELSGLRDAA